MRACGRARTVAGRGNARGGKNNARAFFALARISNGLGAISPRRRTVRRSRTLQHALRSHTDSARAQTSSANRRPKQRREPVNKMTARARDDARQDAENRNVRQCTDFESLCNDVLACTSWVDIMALNRVQRLQGTASSCPHRRLLRAIHPDRVAEPHKELAGRASQHANNLRDSYLRDEQARGAASRHVCEVADPYAAWRAVKAAEARGREAFANVMRGMNVTTGTDGEDAYVYEWSPGSNGRTSNEPDSDGWFRDNVYTFHRLCITFAALTREGRGWDNEDGSESATFTWLRELVLDPIARCIAAETRAECIRFFVINAIPTIAYAGQTPTPALLRRCHEDFNVQNDSARLGVLSRDQVREALKVRFRELKSHVAPVGMRGATWSNKVRALLGDEMVASLQTEDEWTFDVHPTANGFGCNKIALFERLLCLDSTCFDPLKRIPTLLELVNCDILQARGRVAASLEELLEAVPVKTATEFLDDVSYGATRAALFKWQHEAVCECVSKFVAGERGAIVTLDVGLGKTHVGFTFIAVLLLGNAVTRAVMCVEHHAAESAKEEFESFLREYFQVAANRYKTEHGFSASAMLQIVVSGHTSAHRKAMDDAFAGVEGNGVVVIDEVSRYVGDSLDDKGVVLLAAEAARLRHHSFVLGMTATPVTAHLTRFVNVLCVAGALVTVDAAQVARSCVVTLNELHRQQQDDEDVRAIVNVNNSLNGYVDALIALAKRHTVGGLTMTAEARAEIEIIRQRIDIRRTVTLFHAPTLSDALGECAAAAPKSFWMCAELHVAAAAAVHFPNRDVQLQPEPSETTRALLASLKEELESGAPVLIFFPSVLRAAMHAVYLEVRACVTDPSGVHIIDGTTAECHRARMFQVLNDTGKAMEDAQGDRIAGRTCLLFVTTETGAYGRNCFDVHTVVFVSTGWTDASTVQVYGRSVRLCSDRCVGRTKRMKLLMPMSIDNGQAYQRFSRSGARGQFFTAVAPAVIHADRPSIVVNGAIDRPPRNQDQRDAFALTVGHPLRVRLFGDEGNDLVVDMAYADYVESWNEVLTAAAVADGQRPVDLRFAACGGGGGGRADDSGEEQEGNREEDDDPEGQGADANVRNGRNVRNEARQTRGQIHVKSQIRRRVAHAYASRTAARLPPLPDIEDPEAQTDRVARQVARIRRELALAEERDGETPRPSQLTDDTGYFIPKDTNSPLRRQLIFASAIADVALRNNKPPATPQRRLEQRTASSAYFAYVSPRPRNNAESEANRAYGVRHEAVAIEHISRKYGNLELITGIGQYTRVHPQFPWLLATVDAVSTCGVVLEIKCIRDYEAYLHAVAGASDGPNQKYTDYVDQVRAQLEVFDLQLGLLCLCHVQTDGRVLSIELPVFRDSQWLNEQTRRTFASLLAAQENFLKRLQAWEDVI